MKRRDFLTIALAGTAMAAAGARPAFAAATHTIKMLNTGKDGPMVFEPAVVKAKPGDTIRFVATDKGHNAELIAGMAPAGVTLPKGAMGKDVSYTLAKPGVYGFKCAPHYGMGMVALIQVGAAANKAAVATVAAKAPGIAKKRFATYLTRVA